MCPPPPFILAEPLAGAALRASLEEAAQSALHAADCIIAVLDRMDGDTDRESVKDDEPSLAAPQENVTGSQVVYMRGNDWDGEAETPEIVLHRCRGRACHSHPPYRGMAEALCSRLVALCCSTS